jgi:hypothetical protein
MNRPSPTPERAGGSRRRFEWPEIVFAGDAKRSTLSQAVSRGRLVRLASGIYSGAVEADPADIARRTWWKILVHEYPGAAITDRSARTQAPVDGVLTIVHTRRRPLVMPGLTISPRTGPRTLEGDIALPDGIVLASQARGLLDNLASAGDRYLSSPEVETWLADLLQHQGEGWVNTLRDRARTLAARTKRPSAFERLDHLIAAALATGPADDLETPVLRARSRGEPYDRNRIGAFTSLVAELQRLAPEPLPALPAFASRRRLLPFYEAYFSNYIEGTEFTLDEAAAIVFDGDIPPSRPQDAHDIAGTYSVVADEAEMRRAPQDADTCIDLLLARHAVVRAGRPEARPGRFKDRANRAGSSVFVSPDLVEGTLRAGFDRGGPLVDPFARAVFMMFLVAEVHPFTDGNGRIARIAMNAELVAADEVRLVIPTVSRNNYLAALKGATHNGSYAALIATLRFAQRYTARIDFSSRETAEPDLARTNALLDPTEAEDNGVRLVLP